MEKNRLNTNKWKKIDNYFKDYCEHSSIIGFNYVAEKRSKGERILWIILIVLALACSIYFIMEQYNKYAESPFIVTLATQETPIFNIPFPAITICPLTKANRTMFNFTNVVHKLWDNITISDYESETAQYMTMICDEENMDGLVEEIPQSFLFNDTFYERLKEVETTGVLMMESFTCKYMSQEFECSDLFSPIILDGGVCYTFNMLNRDEIFRPNVKHYSNYHSGQLKSSWTNDDGYRAGTGRDAYPKRALQAGADNSFQMMIMALNKDVDYICSTEIGYSITVHTPHTVPQTKKDFFILPLGSSTQAILSPNVLTTSAVVKGYKPEIRKCYFTDERKLKYFLIYTQGNCQIECLTNYTLNKCQCVSFFMPRENGTSLCGNFQRKCLQDAEDEYKTLELNVDMGLSKDYYGCKCMPLCSQISYQTNTHRNAWKGVEYLKAHKKAKLIFKYTDSDIDKGQYSVLKIFFKDDYFISYDKSELYGVFDFISNFGGLLGLFTGFSLLTAAEIIYYISLRIWCNKKLYNDVSGPIDSD